MTKHSLTNSELQIIKPEDDDRKFLFSVAKLSGAEAVYVRIGDAGGIDFCLSDWSTSALEYNVPAGRAVYAWTDAGTAELYTAKVRM